MTSPAPRYLPILRNVSLVLLAMAFFGNLYEAVVYVPFLSSLPPGTLQIKIGFGSPPLYFLPPGAGLLVLPWVVAWRVRGQPDAARPALIAAGCITLALAITVVAVVLVLTPGFTDPANTATADTMLTWELLNAVRLVLYVAAAVALLRISRTSPAIPA